MLEIEFYGAAREVTGSCHILRANGETILLDCGLFQGRRAEAMEKSRRFPFHPSEVGAVLLSHAHIDHCGRLPLLARGGFKGPIYCTAATRDLCAIMLIDSAHIQAEDARYISKKQVKNGGLAVEPLYTDEDVNAAIALFHVVPNGDFFDATMRIRARFHEAGHMPGAVSMELEYHPPVGGPVRLVFSGDLGRFNMPILRDPAALPVCDYLICESTYGARRHPPAEDLPGQLADVVNRTVARGGKIIIPAFSVGRTQVIVYTLHKLLAEGTIAPLPVFVDSPLSVGATEVFRNHVGTLNEAAGAFHRDTGDFLGGSDVVYITEVEESKRLNTRKAPCVIISASGMCETGRIVHHIRNNIESPRNTILIVGFQAAHTLGRRIVEKQTHVTIFGHKLKLRAEVVALNGFSAHADREELRRLVAPLSSTCKKAFLVHGEADQMASLGESLEEDGFGGIEMPEAGQVFRLGQ